MTKREKTVNNGDYCATKAPMVLHTLLGSCVAVCLFDTRLRIGGMNHILLPGSPDLSRFDASARYGINAMELLINAIIKLGGSRRNLIAKVFGGASVLPAIHEVNHVGRKNARFALSFLERESIPVVAQNLGGKRARKLFFHTDTGAVFLKHLPIPSMPPIAHREKMVLRRKKTAIEAPGEIVLFNPGKTS